MFLTWLMLAVALCLSTIAAFYSIIGLTAIFAAAVIPVAIMGTILEIAKLTVTVWLHEYWRQCKRTMKAYLVPAVGILMLITSMGIFGFLSKAHLDQAVPAGDITAQVAIFDEKIKTQRDNIEAARNALRQMDAQVDQVLGRTTDDKGAERAVQIRRQQAGERTRLQNDISKAQTEIQRLQEQRAPIAAQARKVEAEVGPIKYIAALIYGDNPDQGLLEKAVRWVIIILVIVFDPLAIFMLLAATESYKWEKYRAADPLDPAPTTPPQQPVMDSIKSWREKIRSWRKRDADVAVVEPTTPDLAVQPPGHHVADQPLAPVVAPAVLTEVAPAIEPQQSNTESSGLSGGETKQDPKPKDLPAYQVLDDADDEDPALAQSPPTPLPEMATPAQVDAIPHDEDDEDDETDHSMKLAKKLWKTDHPRATLKEQRRLYALGHIDRLPWVDYLPDPDSDLGHGPKFPTSPSRGHVWVKTDAQPTTLWKFNGDRWIQIDKDMTDRYSYDDGYIDFLIDSISRGEYDPDLLTEPERAQIESRLKKDLS